ncbi:uncharacterized protein BYT42DRAFT_510612 [Radiomyces spectabilis]|uniref:uncharacterized protein n=1 Tax=Radiomyces spectabilis TaxID=64574 RepID=UPI00221F2DAB|nr:uncharacterized protein BYT42DRAFT_510612 [Radiomyces spectabilis]KAI8388275.1 hypothetical protein BYT42DRAFT_510612 [Radiomyces spectabilis]
MSLPYYSHRSDASFVNMESPTSPQRHFSYEIPSAQSLLQPPRTATQQRRALSVAPPSPVLGNKHSIRKTAHSLEASPTPSRLNIAERFMSPNYSKDYASCCSSCTSNTEQVSSHVNSTTLSNSGFVMPPLSDHAPVDVSFTSSPATSRRLTIADTFMTAKPSSILSSHHSISLDGALPHGISHHHPHATTRSSVPNMVVDMPLQVYNETRLPRPWPANEKLITIQDQLPNYHGEDPEKCMETSEKRVSVNTYKTSTQQRSKSEGLSNNEPSPGCSVGCCFLTYKQGRSRTSRRKRNRKPRSCGRRGWTICIFLSVVVCVLVAYLLWPRTPLMRVEGASLTNRAKITQTHQGEIGNVAFETGWLVNVTVDNRRNYVPIRLNAVQVAVKDSLTGLIIGRDANRPDTDNTAIVVPPMKITTIELPIYINYQARTSTDTTFVDLVQACTLQHQRHEALQLQFWITLYMFGLDWIGYKPTVVATPATGGFACPLDFPS